MAEISAITFNTYMSLVVWSANLGITVSKVGFNLTYDHSRRLRYVQSNFNKSKTFAWSRKSLTSEFLSLQQRVAALDTGGGRSSCRVYGFVGKAVVAVVASREKVTPAIPQRTCFQLSSNRSRRDLRRGGREPSMRFVYLCVVCAWSRTGRLDSRGKARRSSKGWGKRRRADFKLARSRSRSVHKVGILLVAASFDR